MDQLVLLQAEESLYGPGRRSKTVPIDHRHSLKSSFFRLRLRRACRISHWDPEDQAAGGWQQNHRPAQSALVGPDRPPGVFGVDALAGDGAVHAQGRIWLFRG